MAIGDAIEIRGFVTQYKYVARRSLRDLEDLLGFQTGRLAHGAVFATLDRLPRIDEFETAGYSQVAAHRHRMPPDLDPVGLRRLAMTAWALAGPDRLVKIFAATRHDPAIPDDVQYPPGLGVPQWKLVRPVPGRVAGEAAGYGAVFALP